MRSFQILNLAILVFICSCTSTSVSVSKALQIIDKDELLQDVLFLSDDDMEGRSPATAGENKAIDFISKRFRANGLLPINESYFQSIRMMGSKKINDKSRLSITSGNDTLQYNFDVNLTYFSASQKEYIDIKNVPLVFVGYGIEAPEYEWDDIKGADLKGKVLLFLRNEPSLTENDLELFKGDELTYYGSWSYKFEQAKKLGASGIIMIHTKESAGYPFSKVQKLGSRERFALELPDKDNGLDFIASIDSTISDVITQSMASNLKELFENSASRDFRPIDTGYRITTHVETKVRNVQTKNVWGIVPGKDSLLKSQYIVLTAHYDHLAKKDSLDGDDIIYNGAWDNAIGTACIINMAKAFSALKEQPKRSIIFLACAAEEVGYRGSQWFVENPPVEKKQLVANFNIDMPQIFGLTTDISALGLDMSTLGETFIEVAQQYKVKRYSGEKVNLEVFGDLNPKAGRFYRSDQISFAKAGIPALYFKPGNQYTKELAFNLEEYRKSHYHTVDDEVDDAWDLTGCERDLRIQFQTVLKVANANDIPRWVEGSEFEEQWIKLHGISD